MKRIIILLGLVFSIYTSASAAEQIVLTKANYITLVREAIGNAESSIDIQMYFIIVNPRRANDPVTTLVNDLVKAQRRGVSVRVVMEDSKLELNSQATKTLMQSGAEVYFDTGASLMHSKVVVIDKKVCIVGSANWSRAAIEKNHEVGVLINSEELGEALVRTFEDIKLRDYTPILPVKMKGVPVPHSILLKGGPLPAMISDRAEHSFNMYLYMLRQGHDSGNRTIPFNTPALKKELDCGNVRKPRLKLVEEYKVITYDASKKEITIIPTSLSPSLPLLPVRQSRRTSQSVNPSAESTSTQRTNHASRLTLHASRFTLPYKYWDDDLWLKLTLRGKYMYLVSLSESARSSRAPYWFRSQKDMAEMYGISEYTISLGLQELEEREIIEVERGRTSGPGMHGDRKANIYCINPLISDKERAERMEVLIERHGEKVIKQAQKMADQLDEPNDLDDIATFALLIAAHGYEDVKKANDYTRKLKKGSSRRNIQTTLRVLADPE